MSRYRSFGLLGCLLILLFAASLGLAFSYPDRSLGQAIFATRTVVKQSFRSTSPSAGLSAVAEPSPLRPPTPKPASSPHAYVGVWQPGAPGQLASLKQFERDAHKKVAMVMFWRDFAGPKSYLNPSWLHNTARAGAVPVISWSPANWDGGSQKPYSLANIIAGRWDGYLRGWAKKIRGYGKPVFIRWAHEMNGNWYSWGWQPHSYIAAWRHIHTVFQAAGASNVQWVWCPNTEWGDPRSKFRQYYPGDRYVDWTCLDAYNSPARKGWIPLSMLIYRSYRDMLAITPKPIMLGEISSGEATPLEAQAGLSKAQWIVDALDDVIPTMPRIKAFLWFNENKQRNGNYDFRIESSRATQHAFARAVSIPYYRSYYP